MVPYTPPKATASLQMPTGFECHNNFSQIFNDIIALQLEYCQLRPIFSICRIFALVCSWITESSQAALARAIAIIHLWLGRQNWQSQRSKPPAS